MGDRRPLDDQLRHEANCSALGVTATSNRSAWALNIGLQKRPVIRRELESPRNETGVFSTWKRRVGRACASGVCLGLGELVAVAIEMDALPACDLPGSGGE